MSNKKVLSDLTLEITNQCNLKCRFCNIWKERTKKLLTLNDVKKIISSINRRDSIGFVSLTGGEPFLHPQLDQIYKFLTILRFKKIIKSIGIYSNGYAMKKMINFLADNERYLQGLELGISLDGWGKIHNYLRGKGDTFKKTIGTIEKIRSKFAQVKVEVKVTISPLNLKDLWAIYTYCRDRGFIFSPKFVEKGTVHYYHRHNDQDLGTSFSEQHKNKIKDIISKILRKEGSSKNKIVNPPTLKMLIKYVEEGDRVIRRCFTPLRSLFITCSGDVHPCLYLAPIANIRKDGWEKEIMGYRHKEIIKKGYTASCPRCFAYHGFLKSINVRKNL